MRVREGVVAAIRSRGEGWTEATVRIAGEDGEAVALAYHGLTPELHPGDRVVLNTTAVHLGLGTGGFHFITAVHGRTLEAALEGHVMKVRYTPSQVKVLAVEEEDSPYREVMEGVPDLQGVPVAVGTLHSQVPVVAATLRALRPAVRIGYVMTDGAALPAAFSRTLPKLKAAGILDCVVTAGHAFGGDLEAVTAPSAIVAAVRAARCDAVIVAMGPGSVGTGTALGTTALEMGPLLDAAGALGATPVAVARVNFADPRERHHGISHHVITALKHFTRGRAVVPLPHLDDPAQKRLLDREAEELAAKGHEIRWIDGRGAYLRAKPLLERAGVRVTTMGRGDGEDPAFFFAAAAAGRYIGEEHL